MRHVIRNELGLYYTEMRIVESRELRKNGEVIAVDDTYRPAFESFKPETASQLNTKQDAVELMNNPLFGQSTQCACKECVSVPGQQQHSFSGCQVISYSTDAKE